MNMALNLIKTTLAFGIRNFSSTAPRHRSSKVNLFDLNFDRRIKVDFKDSIRYLESEAYKRTYSDRPVWYLYRRNHKSIRVSPNTRRDCIDADGFLTTSYPCSICRDEYLVLHPENVKLLKQFIDPYTGEMIGTERHGLCLKQWRNLIIAIKRAIDLGLLTDDQPDRLYDYKEYYGQI